MDESNIRFPYRGSRASAFVYHPAKHGPWDTEGVWEQVLGEFRKKLDTLCEVSALYVEHERLHETVGGPKWHKDVLALVGAIEKDGKDVYQLEALSEMIFDVENKAAQRVLPYPVEIRRRASEIHHEDSGLIMPGAHARANGKIVWHGWAG